MERRFSPRIPTQLHAMYRPADEESFRQCVLIDVSGSGIGIMLGDTLPAGKNFLFTIDMINQEIKAAGQVIWSKKLRGYKGLHNAAGIKILDIDGRNIHDLIDYAEEQILRDMQL